MSLLFSGITFLVTSTVHPSTVATLQRCGARVVYAFEDEVTVAVQRDCEEQLDSLPDIRRVKGLRVPVVFERWVRTCAAQGRVLPLTYSEEKEEVMVRSSTPALEDVTTTTTPVRSRGLSSNSSSPSCTSSEKAAAEADDLFFCSPASRACSGGRSMFAISSLVSLEEMEGGGEEASKRFIAYDTAMFQHVVFTTTQLPGQFKENVIAALQFYGARYSPHLTTATNLLVYGRLLGQKRHGEEGGTVASAAAASEGGLTSSPPGAVASSSHHHRCESKLEVATSLGIPRVTASWVHACLQAGRRLPIFGSNNTDVCMRLLGQQQQSVSVDASFKAAGNTAQTVKASLSVPLVSESIAEGVKNVPSHPEHSAFPSSPSLPTSNVALEQSAWASTQGHLDGMLLSPRLELVVTQLLQQDQGKVVHYPGRRHKRRHSNTGASHVSKKLKRH